MEKETPNEFELRVRDNEITRNISTTPTEEWEKNNLIEHNGNYYVRCEAHEEVVRRLQEKHKEALTSHDAELARKIKGTENTQTTIDGRTGFENCRDAVLALLGTKK